MLHHLWMRPALQKSEAVLMPAMQRHQVAEPQFSDWYNRQQPHTEDYISIAPDHTTTALSTYVRPRGSMGGRSVLRAVGVMAGPYTMDRTPRYYRNNHFWNDAMAKRTRKARALQ